MGGRKRVLAPEGWRTFGAPGLAPWATVRRPSGAQYKRRLSRRHPLLVGVPRHPRALTVGEVRQVRRGDDAVAQLDRRVRVLVVLHTLDPVLHVQRRLGLHLPT